MVLVEISLLFDEGEYQSIFLYIVIGIGDFASRDVNQNEGIVITFDVILDLTLINFGIVGMQGLIKVINLWVLGLINDIAGPVNHDRDSAQFTLVEVSQEFKQRIASLMDRLALIVNLNRFRRDPIMNENRNNRILFDIGELFRLARGGKNYIVSIAMIICVVH